MSGQNGRHTMNRVLIFAAVGEAATGLALLLWPAVVVHAILTALLTRAITRGKAAKA